MLVVKIVFKFVVNCVVFNFMEVMNLVVVLEDYNVYVFDVRNFNKV